MKKMKTVLIAGGAGFLGSHLSGFYLAKNYRAIAIDNLLTGDLQNIAEFKKNKNFQFYQIDICQKFPPKILNQEFDLILNFACPASPVHYQRLAKETLATCSSGLENLIRLALKNKTRLIHSSTSEVYGDPIVHPQTESYWGNVNSYGPRSMYDEGKRFGEALLWSYQNKYKLNAGIVRIFNTYGPKMAVNDGRVVSNFIVQALKNKPLTVEGDGRQTRSFCYVDDLVKGIYLLSQSKLQTPVNMGNPSEFTLLQLAKKVLTLTGSKSKLKYLPPAPDGPKQRKPDITKAKKNLGWSPKINLDEGLEKTINYFKGVK